MTTKAQGLEKSLISEYSGWDGDTWTLFFHDAVLRVPLGLFEVGATVELALNIEASTWEIYQPDGQLHSQGPLTLLAP